MNEIHIQVIKISRELVARGLRLEEALEIALSYILKP